MGWADGQEIDIACHGRENADEKIEACLSVHVFSGAFNLQSPKMLIRLARVWFAPGEYCLAAHGHPIKSQANTHFSEKRDRWFGF